MSMWSLFFHLLPALTHHSVICKHDSPWSIDLCLTSSVCPSPEQTRIGSESVLDTFISAVRPTEHLNTVFQLTRMFCTTLTFFPATPEVPIQYHRSSHTLSPNHLDVWVPVNIKKRKDHSENNFICIMLASRLILGWVRGSLTIVIYLIGQCICDACKALLQTNKSCINYVFTEITYTLIYTLILFPNWMEKQNNFQTVWQCRLLFVIIS